MRWACSWSFQKPGSLISRSRSTRRAASRSGSKVITDPVELDPDFFELLLQACAFVGHRGRWYRAVGLTERRGGNATGMARTRKRRLLRRAIVGWLAAYFFDPRAGRA